MDFRRIFRRLAFVSASFVSETGSKLERFFGELVLCVVFAVGCVAMLRFNGMALTNKRMDALRCRIFQLVSLEKIHREMH